MKRLSKYFLSRQIICKFNFVLTGIICTTLTLQVCTSYDFFISLISSVTLMFTFYFLNYILLIGLLVISIILFACLSVCY